MPRLRAPGVYFEKTDSPSRVVSEARTDIAAFVGVAERGPLHVPVRIDSWTQFHTRFGDPTVDGFLAVAVRGFFANGGQTCWVVRVGVPPPGYPDDYETYKRCLASSQLVNRAGLPVFVVRARDFGPATEQITVRVEPAASPPGDPRFTLVLSVRGETLEIWRDLSPVQSGHATSVAPGDSRARSAEVKVNAPLSADDPNKVTADYVNGSALIRLEAIDIKLGDDPLPVGVALKPRGTDPYQRTLYSSNTVAPLGIDQRAVEVLSGLTLAHFTGENQPPDVIWGLKALEAIEEVGMVAAPDLVWTGLPMHSIPPSPRPCQVLTAWPVPTTVFPVARWPLSLVDQAEGHRAVIRHCAAKRSRFGILDAPAGIRPDEAIAWAAKNLRSDAGQFAGLYYPWVYVPDPEAVDGVQLIPPSGHAAGVFARVDLTVGVQKPPANEALNEVCGVEIDIDPADHGLLNDQSVNAIRSYPGRGIRIAGARTLVPPGDPDLRPWRSVNVRRLLMMIEESIDQSAQWAVFRSNTPALWREVDRVVRSFLDDEWRKGRLDGASAAEAYSVTCDNSTNPPADVAAGRLTCVIGVQPPQPAEFVVVRLGKRIGEDGAAGTGGLNGG